MLLPLLINFSTFWFPLASSHCITMSVSEFVRLETCIRGLVSHRHSSLGRWLRLLPFLCNAGLVHMVNELHRFVSSLRLP